jgi:hypothetical protein
MAPMPSRIRLLVATSGLDATGWDDWQQALRTNPFAPRMALQRVDRKDAEQSHYAVGVGYGETLWWFAPINGRDTRGLVIQFAAAVLEGNGFCEPPAALCPQANLRHRCASPKALCCCRMRRQICWRSSEHVPNYQNRSPALLGIPC